MGKSFTSNIADCDADAWGWGPFGGETVNGTMVGSHLVSADDI